MIDDKELVLAVLEKGRREAYTTLVERYQFQTYRLCYRVTGNYADAEDLAHEAFVEAFVKLDRLNSPEKFAPWLRTLTLNLGRIWYRRARRCPDLEPAVDVPAIDRCNTDSVNVALSRGLSQLSPEHRLALALHYSEGLSYADVASFLGVPIGTVMSRLHRAKKNLKTAMEDREMDGKIQIQGECDLTSEVDAEINTLIQMFRHDRSLMERLSVVLERSPERFIDLIRNANEYANGDDVALLLRRLGTPAMEVVMSCYASTEPPLRNAAETLLRRFVTNGSAGLKGPSSSRMAWRGVYILVDVLSRSQFAEARKAELLLDLLRICPDEPTSLLLMNALLMFDSAIDLLWGGFRSSHKVEAVVLQTLCRLGTRFGVRLVDMLADGGAILSALTGAEGLVRSLRANGRDLATLSDTNLRVEHRFVKKWVPPFPSDRDPVVIDALAGAVASHAFDESAETRNLALRTLGLLGCSRYAELVRNAARHADETTRLAALRAIADTDDRSSVDVLMAALEAPGPHERRTAVEVLGHMRLEAALDHVAQRVDDPDPSVRRVAVIALGEIGGEEAHAQLRGLLKSNDRAIAKAAVSALFGTSSPGVLNGPPFLDNADVRRSPTISGDLMRNGAVPPFLICLEAAVAAIPDAEPYAEVQFTRFIAQACYDYSSTRRYLVEEGLARRAGGVYELTEFGLVIWRVERSMRNLVAKV